MFIASILLLIVLTIAKNTPNTIEKILTPLKRSDQLIKGWKSEQCQNYLNKGFFNTVEDDFSCRATNKENRNCPPNRGVYSMLQKFPPNNGIWPCLVDKEEYQERLALISHRHKFIFLSNPKVGSSTILSMMAEEFQMLKQYIPISSIPKEQFSSYFIFTFVRDPVKRMESGIGESIRRGVNVDSADFLQKLTDGCMMNFHAFTQAKYLRALNPWTNENVEYDFIGSMSTAEIFAEDVSFLFTLLKEDPSKRRVLMRLPSYKALFVLPDSFIKVEKAEVPIRHNNAGEPTFHTSLDYNDETVRSNMCLLTKHDMACFPSINENLIGC